MFSVLDGTNTISGKNTGLPRQIRFYSLSNMYINCRNHRLALCLPHLIKDANFAELLIDYDSLLLDIWKMFHFSPKKGAVLQNVQSIYGKRPLKILKAAVTRWLTHGRVSQIILDCFKELLETLDHICLETKETVRGYGDMLMEDCIAFCLCLMTDILALMNTLSLAFQKQSSLLVDITHMVEEAFNTTDSPVMDAFHVFDPRNIPKDLPSGYGEKEINLIYDFYGSNKINIFQGQRNEATAIIKCSKENFTDQAVHYFC